MGHEWENPRRNRRRANDAFDGIRRSIANRDTQIGSLNEQSQRNLDARNYFRAGLSYFTTSNDPYLKMVAQEVFEGINHGDPNRIGLLSATLENNSYTQNVISFQSSKTIGEYASLEKGDLLVAPLIIEEADVRPLEVLVSLIFNVSVARDFMNSGTYSKEAMGMAVGRGMATIAHFLHALHEEEPTLEDPVYSEYSELLQEYPRGIDSLSGGRYKSVGMGDPTHN